MSGYLRLLVVGMLFVLVGCGADDARRRTTPPECRRAEDCLLPTADGGGVIPACRTAECVDNKCTTVPVDDGTTCDDGDSNTQHDACHSMSCKGIPATCPEKAGPCEQATIDPVTNTCKVTSLPDGTTCDDGDLCTETDACDAGKCVGGSKVTCTASDGCHVDGTCDPKTGKCDEPKADDGTPCDDALSCTESDACNDGVCKGTDVVCDDGLACSKDSCDETAGGCQVDMSACACDTSATCDDGNVCNGVESCNTSSGFCQPGTAIDCSAKSDACHRGTCDQGTGSCVATAVADGLECDDGSLCTKKDSCQKGTCTGASPVTCAVLDQCHSVGACDPKTGACANPPKADGVACDDALTCTTGDACKAGACGGVARVCNDGIACTVDGCSEASGGCTADTGKCGCTKDADCTDGNACNGTETCNLATNTCKTGTPVDCSSATDACHTGTCNAANGTCTAVAKPNGTTCSDANGCTQFDACQSGKCTGTPVVCPAPDQCHTAGACTPASGTCSNPVKPTGTTCNDGLTCTTGDACSAAGACAGAARVCNDGVACTVDSCTEAAGGCTADRSACGCAKDADCNDGNACNGAETCNLATLTCKTGTAVNCGALTDACNTGTCNPTNGACTAVPKANGGTCSDGSLCTQNDACQAGKCVGAAVVCPAADQCHNARACDPTSGACTNPNKPNGTTCSDGKTCTSTDVCTGGVCGGGALACADTIACTVDSCVEPTGCAHNTSACQCTKSSDCNDGNACNGVETCDLATFTCKVGTAVSCTALNDACNTGTCDQATGQCSKAPKPNGTTCNDNALCTGTDVCTAGRCAGTPVVCPAPDQCHNTRSCDPTSGACTNPAKANGTPCSDALFCTTADVCTSGTCGGTVVTCNDGIACTVDACTEAAKGCTSSTAACQCTKDADCNNGNACDGVETCNLGNFTCVKGTAVDCSKLTAACTTGTCNTTTGACSAVPKTGVACNDGNACTATDTCSSAGVCVGAGAVPCPVPTNPCHVAACVAPTGCVENEAPNNTPCNDGSTCTTSDVCVKGACTGSPVDDKVGDWGDDPGGQGSGPLSIDFMTLGSGALGTVGVYTGAVDFAGSPLAYNTDYRQEIYFNVYGEQGTGGAGKSLSRVAIAGVQNSQSPGSLTINAASVASDDSFTIIGSMRGKATFGFLNANPTIQDFAQVEPFIARFEKDGSLRWVGFGFVVEGTATMDALTTLSDNAVIVAGINQQQQMLIVDAAGKQSTITQRGAWAARFEPNGSASFVQPVATAKDPSTMTVRGATGHSDGSFSLLGGFTTTALLGSDKPQQFDTAGGIDAWFVHVERDGATLRFAGRLGDASDDRPGAIQGIAGDAIAIAVDTLGRGPSLDSAATSTPLHIISTGTYQTQLVQLDKSGKPAAASLVGAGKGATQAFALGLGADGSLTLGGVFDTTAQVFDQVGFGGGAPTAASVTLPASSGLNLLAVRWERTLKRRWATSVGGVSSGMLGGTGWDIVMAVHPSLSVTLGGMFQSQSTFGVALPKTLIPANKAGSPFVTHFDSQNALEPCK